MFIPTETTTMWFSITTNLANITPIDWCEIAGMCGKATRFSMPLPLSPCPQSALSSSSSRRGAHGSLQPTVNCTRLFCHIPLSSAQTPTLVQHVNCPNSSLPPNSGSPMSSTPLYTCPFPEPTQAGNAIVGFTSTSSGGPYAVSDDTSNSYTLVNTVTDSKRRTRRIYVATDVAAGTRMITGQMDQENGSGWMIAPSTSSQGFTWNLYFTTSDAAGYWFAEADEFK